ncbi:MAG: Smr/MutS family protein [Holophagaceae bacterium]|nr:Smr/MutS family protein [Holophagaceae bacterium]
MAWKQDLAKLKQQLGPETPVAPKPTPRPAPKPTGSGSLDDEDAMFLSAMGLKAAKATAPTPTQEPAPPEAMAPAEPLVPETFQEAVKELKGLKALPRGLQHSAKHAKTPAKATPAEQPAPVVPPPPVEAAHPPQEVPATPLPPAPPEVPAPTLMPLRFQLAAGMALEVDGTLDLRGHTLDDAVHRLQDRLGDGLVLGWRSLLVTLGPDPVLHQGLLDLLASGQVPMVARFAQAPVPMGGHQAWLLYFVAHPTHP